MYELLPVNNTDYQVESSSQQILAIGLELTVNVEDDRARDPRAGKKRREHKDATTTADLSCVAISDGIVLNRTAEPAAHSRGAGRGDQTMEAPIETGQNETATQAAAAALAQKAIATPPDKFLMAHIEPEIAGARQLATETPDTPANEALTKSQRSARDSNARFFRTIKPLLDGRADFVPCFKCEIPECILASKSKGDKAPAFQAQLQGKKYGKTVAPSICMAFWYGAGTSYDYLLASSAAAIVPDTVQEDALRKDSQSTALTPEQKRQMELAKRANATESALLSLEQALRDAAVLQARMSASIANRDTNFQTLVEARKRCCVEDKNRQTACREYSQPPKQTLPGRKTPKLRVPWQR